MADIPLEDFCEDILGKACRGLGVSREALSAGSGVETGQLERILAGDYRDAKDREAVRSMAAVLGLDPDKLVSCARGDWYPRVSSPDGLGMENTPYRDMRVNAYVLWDPASRRAALFDTGADASGLLATVAERRLRVERVFLTHGHNDHILDLDRIRDAIPGVPIHAGEREEIPGAEPFAAGRTFALGALRIGTRLTWGHSRGGITYTVDGLAAPVAVVGDAVFAGSMGGGMVSYADALRTNREEILGLAAETILCPGHGPLTTVGEEREHNPFF